MLLISLGCAIRPSALWKMSSGTPVRREFGITNLRTGDM